MTVRTAETPRVADAGRITIGEIAPGFIRIEASYGFMESPNLPKALRLCGKHGLGFDISNTSFFLGRKKVVASYKSGMPKWQDDLYVFLLSNSADPTEFFNIPRGRVVELGTQISV